MLPKAVPKAVPRKPRKPRELLGVVVAGVRLRGCPLSAGREVGAPGFAR